MTLLWDLPPSGKFSGHPAHLSVSPSSFTSSYLRATTGGSAGTLASRRALCPAWWLKGCRRRPSEEEWCSAGGGAKPGGESERSCLLSRCASRGCCWGSSSGSSPRHREQVRSSFLFMYVKGAALMQEPKRPLEAKQLLGKLSGAEIDLYVQIHSPTFTLNSTAGPEEHPVYPGWKRDTQLVQ